MPCESGDWSVAVDCAQLLNAVLLIVQFVLLVCGRSSKWFQPISTIFSLRMPTKPAKLSDSGGMLSIEAPTQPSIRSPLYLIWLGFSGFSSIFTLFLFFDFFRYCFLWKQQSFHIYEYVEPQAGTALVSSYTRISFLKTVWGCCGVSCGPTTGGICSGSLQNLPI